jgi:hypothetical protein
MNNLRKTHDKGGGCGSCLHLDVMLFKTCMKYL